MCQRVCSEWWNFGIISIQNAPAIKGGASVRVKWVTSCLNHVADIVSFNAMISYTHGRVV